MTLLVIDALESLRVPYFIGGSLASAVHGVVRATMDVDIVADLRLEHVEPLVRILGDAFYADAEMMRAAVRQVARKAHTEEDLRMGVKHALSATLQALRLTATPEYKKTTLL